MKRRFGGILFLVLFLGGTVRGEELCSAAVPTSCGLVRGESEKETDVCVWRGIPYAAPPVGPRRWRSPEPMPAWSGVREARAWGNRCMQKGIFKLEAMEDGGRFSEDCLYLNIWRPKKAGIFPVMVWVHGGGYVGGAGNTPMYWGDRLAAAGDVVVVTFNYRLNIFGFFAHPALRAEDPHQAAGSQGSLDQVAALKWVHENIGNFGGDPGNVTIFGESAGGFSICTLLATPLARGLFHRAILESGGCDVSGDLESGYQLARATAEQFGCPAEDVECLRKIPAKVLLAKGSVGTSHMAYLPRHDNYLLSASPLQMIRAGDYNRVPFLAGYNRDEFGKAMKLKAEVYYTRPAQYEETLRSSFHLSAEDSQRLVELYPLAEFNGRPVEAYGRMFGVDLALACPTYHGLFAASIHQPDTYLYRFDYDDFALGKYIGAAHSFEIPFIFDSLDRMPMSLFYHGGNLGKARELGKIIRSYWLNFARTGNPNGPGLPEWPPFRPDSPRMQVLDENPRTEPAGMADRCGFWETYSTRHHSGMEILKRKK